MAPLCLMQTNCNSQISSSCACGRVGWREGGGGLKHICQLPFLQANALCGSYKVLSSSYRLMKDDGKLIDDIHSIPYAAFILSWTYETRCKMSNYLLT